MVGCGDGQRKRPVQPRKVLPHGKVNGAQGNKNTLNKGSQNLGNQKALNTRNDQDSAIESQKNSLLNEGTLISRDQALSGSYTLNTISSFGKAIMTGKESANVMGLSTSTILNGQIAPANHYESGSIASEADAGREIEVPLTFAIDSPKNEWSGKNSLKVVKSQMDFSTGEISHEITTGTPTLSVLKDIQNANKEANGSYTVVINGRKVFIKILQISSGLRFVFDIEESAAGANNKKGDLSFTRVLILDYKTQNQAATQAPTPALPEAQQTGPDFSPEMAEPATQQ